MATGQLLDRARIKIDDRLEAATKKYPELSILSDVVSIFKVGISSTPVAVTSMFLLITGLGAVKTGKTYVQPQTVIGTILAAGQTAPGVTIQGAPPNILTQDVFAAYNFFLSVDKIFNPLAAPIPTIQFTAPATAAPTPTYSLLGAQPDGFDDGGPDPLDPTKTIKIPWWNTYLLNPTDATNLKVALLAYLGFSALGGSGGVTELSGLLSGAVAALK